MAWASGDPLPCEVTMKSSVQTAASGLFCAVLALPFPGRACDCALLPGPAEALAKAAAVFRGTVVELGGVVDSRIRATFDVETVWKGPQAEVLGVSTGEHEAMCGFPFEMGREYLVFAFGEPEDLMTNICMRTALSREGDAEGLGPPLWVRESRSFRRGDIDANGALDLSDAIHLLDHLFLGEEAPSCIDAADTNDDAVVDLSDAMHVLQFLFLGGPPPEQPFPACGTDPTADPFGCVQQPGCAADA